MQDDTLGILECSIKTTSMTSFLNTQTRLMNLQFETYILLRDGFLLGGLLTNCESWINMTEKDIANLEKPDTVLQRKML